MSVTHKDYVSALVGNIPKGALQLAAAPAVIAQLASHDLGRSVVRGDWTPRKTDALSSAASTSPWASSSSQITPSPMESPPTR